MACYYESQQGPIFYRIHGHKGPVVLLIHGLGASTYCWRHLIPELCHKYKVISFDLWGFGYSSKTMKKKMDLDTQIEVINELLDHLKVNKFHIVGHSMGAEIGLWMKHTDKRVQKCIAITPAAHPNLVSDWFQVFHWVANLTPLLITPNSIRRLLTRSLEDSAFITDDMGPSLLRTLH
jgi:pimeloyl-ACP methyl ester carboxylesterase